MSLRRTDVRGSVCPVDGGEQPVKRLTAMTDEELLRAQGFEHAPEQGGREMCVDTAGEGHVVTRETALRWARKDMPQQGNQRSRGGA